MLFRYLRETNQAVNFSHFRHRFNGVKRGEESSQKPHATIYFVSQVMFSKVRFLLSMRTIKAEVCLGRQAFNVLPKR